MNSTVKQLVTIAVVVLESAVAVLEVIPGNQGEQQIKIAVKVLKGLLVAA